MALAISRTVEFPTTEGGDRHEIAIKTGVTRSLAGTILKHRSPAAYTQLTERSLPVRSPGGPAAVTRNTAKRIAPCGSQNARLACFAAAAGLLALVAGATPALAAEPDDDEDSASAFPNIYLDMRTNYFTVPPGTLALGFNNTLSLPALSSLSSVSGRGVTLDLPLTIDLNDRISVFGGVTGSTSKNDLSPWSSFDMTSWNVGVQADVITQDDGWLPTVTVLSTLTKSAGDGPLSSTNLTTVVEADRALDEDGTRGFLAGVQVMNTRIDSGLASVRPAVIGYLGAYYQGADNWKLTGRAGVQSFGGANTTELVPFLPAGQPLFSLRSFTQPVLRFDLDRMDDNDNRLFGITAAIFWTPQPAFQFTLRTPLYLVRK